MQLYESIFITRPNISEDENTRVLDKIKAVVEKNGGSINQTENWGKKKLAYEVKKERKGVYIIMRFSGSGKLVDELERYFRVEDSILKYMTVKPPKGDDGKIPAQAPVEVRAPRGR